MGEVARRSVACVGMVEVGQHVQGPAEGGQLFELFGYAVGEVVDDGPESPLLASAVGVAVGGGDALVDAAGRFDSRVLAARVRFLGCPGDGL